MICPYCRSELSVSEAVACERCRTPLHAACALVHGKCVTFGCASTRLVETRALVERSTLATPAASPRLRARRAAREAGRVALAPLGDAALVVLGAAGVAGLLALL